MTSGSASTDCVAAAFGIAGWGPGVSKCADLGTVFSAEVGGRGRYIEYCAHYTQLTNEYRMNTISAANRSCLDDHHIDTSAATAVQVVQTIVPCLTAYCEGSTACKTQEAFPCLQESLAFGGQMLSADAVDACTDQICASHPALQANPDIAGIGMISSYIIQLGLALLIALSLLVLSISPGLRNITMTANPRTLSKDQESKPGKESHRDAPQHHKLYESIKQALVAFLLAQNFLALAISIAALQTLNSRGALGPLDEVALGSASGSVILPTVFGLYTLASFYGGSQSWYLFTLSLLSWVLGLSIVLGPQMVRLSAQNRSSAPLYAVNAQSPRVCGNVAPGSICGNLNPNLHPEYAFYYTLCIPIMLGLTVWQFSTLQTVSDLLDSNFPKSFRAKWQGILLFIMHVGAIGFFAAPSYFFFQSIADLLSNDAVNKTWGFGQIVAVLATVPTVVEFIHTYVESNKDSTDQMGTPRSIIQGTDEQSYELLELNVRSSQI